MIGVVLAFAFGIIAGGIGMVFLLTWAFDREVDNDDELPRTDKENLD